MKKKCTNKHHFRKWVVKTILFVDSIIDGIVEIVFPAALVAIACGGIAIALLKITCVI